MTAAQYLDHVEYAFRAAILIFASFIMGFLIGVLVSDREVCDE
jgi:uncharacterized integral membrane protein